MYVKKSKKIPGLEAATTWMYDTTQVELASTYLVENDGPEFEFEGAQLVDS